MKKLLSSLTLILLVIFISPAPAAAVDGIGLSPSIEEIELSQDEDQVSFEVNISNSTKETVDLNLSTLDFGSLDESGGIAFLGKTAQETSVYGLSNWMILEKDRLTLDPGQNQSVKVTIDNKESLGPGGHYGAVVVTAGSPDGNTKDNLAVLPAGSTLVLLKKSGGEIQDLELDSINTNKSIISLPKSATLRFQNTGNVHVVPRGTMELFGPTGSLISRGVINQQSSYVLPESFRQFKVDFSFDSQPWLPGKYKLETTWRYDGKEDPEITTEQYWYIGKLTLIVIGLVCLIIVLFMFRKWRNNPIVRGS